MICHICGKVSPENHQLCLYCGAQQIADALIENNDNAINFQYRRCDIIFSPSDDWSYQAGHILECSRHAIDTNIFTAFKNYLNNEIMSYE